MSSIEVVLLVEDGRVIVNPIIEHQLLEEFENGTWLKGKVEKGNEDFLSPAQRNSLHKYCRLVANDLNAAGYTQQQIMDKFQGGGDIDNSMESIKESVWRRIQKIILGIHSTENLKTKQVGEVLPHVQKFLAQRLGVTTSWPSRESLMMDSYDGK